MDASDGFDRLKAYIEKLTYEELDYWYEHLMRGETHVQSDTTD